MQSVDDILSEIQSFSVLPKNFSAPESSPSQVIDNNDENNNSDIRLKIEAALGTSPAPVDELIRQCQVSPAVLATILLELELAGRLERLPSNRVALVGTV